MPDFAGKGLRFASKGCHSSPGLKAWGFLAWLIKGILFGILKKFNILLKIEVEGG
jgi:hypothetical protein